MLITNHSKAKLRVRFRHEKQKHTCEIDLEPGDNYKFETEFQPDSVTITDING